MKQKPTNEKQNNKPLEQLFHKSPSSEISTTKPHLSDYTSPTAQGHQQVTSIFDGSAPSRAPATAFSR